ncbi:uncharacterized protein LOC141908006 [Tubulanus polymorphus]|uniref:uncharacterized protein LOC141908006 n=1 Tax=Tubulanus polymorphus TaxID=672921 RepID=UPI003DA58673
MHQYAMLKLLWFTAAAAAAVLSNQVLACPQQCTCSSSRDGLQVKCSGQFNNFPTGIPVDVVSLTIVGAQNGSSAITDVTSTSLSTFTKLQTLILTQLGIRNVASDAFASNPTIKDLDLRNNQLSSLPTGLFASFPLLVKLDLSHNQITTIQSGTFTPLISLSFLNLRNNAISSLNKSTFQDLVRLESVDLSDNHVNFLEPNIFQGLNLLRTVKLNNCSLTNLDPQFFSNVPRIKIVDVRNNRISTIASGLFANTSALIDLQLDGNLLTALPSGVLTGLKLKMLGLSKNSISSIDPAVFSEFSCDRLRLADNGMTSLVPGQFDALNGSLLSLYLAGNPFREVTKQMLSFIPKLRILDLSRAKLVSFDPNIVSGLEIQLLNVSRNDFRALGDDVLNAFAKLGLVDLTENNWNCTCFQSNLQTWLNSAGYSQNCVPGNWPNHAANKPLSELRKEFNCLRCGQYPTVNRGKLIANLTAKELEQCIYSASWFTLDRQVMVFAGATCILTVIIFVAFTLICRALRRKQKEYDLKSKTVNNQSVSVIPDNDNNGYASSAPILASMEDLTDGQGRMFTNPAFARSDSRVNVAHHRKPRPLSTSSIPSLDGSEEMTVVIPNQDYGGHEKVHPPRYDEVVRLESAM